MRFSAICVRLLAAPSIAVAAVAPFLIVLGVSLALHARDQARQEVERIERPTRTPNPAPAPSYFLGPRELLMDGNPRWAAWYEVWVVVGAIALVGQITYFVVCFLDRTQTNSQPRPNPSVMRNVAVAFGLGWVFALPWIFSASIWASGH